jgi:two-component system, cell cycle response regulator
MAQILLVDDEKIARSLYSDFLAGAGHQVQVVSSTADAITSLAGHRFDLVVTDLIFPQSDGMELLQWVKSHHTGTEVLVITALDKVEPAIRAIKSGASDYLVKPVTPEVLAQAVTRALTQNSLLKDHEALRRYVTLLEAGQRIATTLDRERLIETTTSGFLALCVANATALFTREQDTLSLAGWAGVAASDRDALSAVIVPLVTDALEDKSRAGHELALTGSEGPYETAFLLPIVDGEAHLGAMLLLFSGRIPEAGVEAGAYLGRHLALALKNLGRFAEVEDLVYLDDLTHLFNSRYLELVLDKEFKNATPNEKPFSLLFLDLDYFKSVNDTHGHVVGSKLLVEVSRVLKGCVRDNDVVCRWGGDEYVLLLRGTDSGGALKVAERIRRAVESHRFLAREGYGLSITTCIGIATYPEHASEKDGLLDFADRAMYRGKKGTRNIIYMASKGLEATPAARHQTQPPEE